MFGSSVAIEGENAVIGAPLDDTGGSNMGSVYLFDATAGSLIRTFNSPGFDSGRMGSSVAVSGDQLMAGAPLSNVGAASAGRAYRFNLLTGTPLQTFNNPEPGLSDFFGSAVGVSGNFVLIGAQSDDPDTIPNAGSAYLFSCPFPTPTPTVSSTPTASPTPTVSPTVTASPDPTVSPTASATPTPSATQTATPSPTPGCDIFLYDESFSAGLGGWTLDNTAGSGGGLWHRSIVCDATLPGHSGPASLAFNRDVTCTYNVGAAAGGQAVSPLIDLTAAIAPVLLSFNYFLQTEGAAPGADLARVDVSTNGFSSFITIADNTPGGGLADPSGGWNSFSADLDAFTGSVIQVRFVFDTLDAFVNAFAGFYADDILVCATDLTAPTPSPTPTPCCPGDANNSGSFVDANDFIAVQANFGADNGVGGLGDANCSGSFVDANDFIAVQANFGADCG